jgi:hypothetical protein
MVEGVFGSLMFAILSLFTSGFLCACTSCHFCSCCLDFLASAALGAVYFRFSDLSLQNTECVSSLVLRVPTGFDALRQT